MQGLFELTTARLVLIGADQALLRAELGARNALAAASNSAVPASWPPEHHDRAVIEWVLNSLDRLAPSEPWRFYYIALNQPRTLIGTCGFKQAPNSAGRVEVGYSILESFRCRGFASEAVMELMRLAFARGATEVAAETYPVLVPSLRVMQKCGMTQVGDGAEPGTARYSKRR